jgi:Uncharacterised protein family (UPF0158)
MAQEPIPIDLQDLCIALESHFDDSAWYLDRQTGDLILLSEDVDDDDLPAPREDIEEDESGRFLLVEPQDSREGYRDMDSFIASIADPHLRGLLEVAISGKGAFRRFKDVLARAPGERERWFAYSGERQRERAREWLASEGIAFVERAAR